MKRVLSLGIANRYVRMIALMVGCAAASLAGAFGGPLALAAVLFVLSAAVMGRLTA